MTHQHLKALGIAGDTLTFLGSVLLAVEALRGPTATEQRRDLVGTAEDLRESGFRTIVEDGRPMDEATVEDREVAATSRISWTGVASLISGFGILLLVRILGE